MLSGLNTTGHEVGGSLGIAVLVSIATAGTESGATPIGVGGMADAFLAAAILAGVGSLIALVILPLGEHLPAEAAPCANVDADPLNDRRPITLILISTATNLRPHANR
jgi:hypothetical protein